MARFVEGDTDPSATNRPQDDSAFVLAAPQDDEDLGIRSGATITVGEGRALFVEE